MAVGLSEMFLCMVVSCYGCFKGSSERLWGFVKFFLIVVGRCGWLMVVVGGCGSL